MARAYLRGRPRGVGPMSIERPLPREPLGSKKAFAHERAYLLRVLKQIVLTGKNDDLTWEEAGPMMLALAEKHVEKLERAAERDTRS